MKHDLADTIMLAVVFGTLLAGTYVMYQINTTPFYSIIIGH